MTCRRRERVGMRYVGSGADKDHSSIRFNDRITLAGIPEEAHRYRLGSRSAVDWIIDRYQVKVDKSSGIVNDPKRSVPAKSAPHATSSTCGPPSTPTRWDQDDRLLPAATGHPRPAVGTCGGLLLVAMASHGAIFAVPDQAKMPPPGPVEVEACRPAHRRSGTWARRVVAGPEDPVGLHVQVIRGRRLLPGSKSCGGEGQHPSVGRRLARRPLGGLRRRGRDALGRSRTDPLHPLQRGGAVLPLRELDQRAR